jgi:hypothetical protein
MGTQTPPPALFGDVLDAIGALSIEDQFTLVDIVKHRLTEQARRQVVASVEEARREFAEGQCRPVTLDQLREEILS